MIRWGEEKRDRDPAHFCRLATAEADKPVWLVCDARRPTDMDYFTSHYPTLTVSLSLTFLRFPHLVIVCLMPGEGVCQ